MRSLGHLLLWTGFLAAAFASVCRLEQADDKWSTVLWNWYAVSMTVGIVGVILLRRVRRDVHVDEARTEAEYSAIQLSLAQVASIVDNLCQRREHVPAEVLRCIDDECAEPLAQFAESRQALVKRFGLNVYASVMTEFASAERYINRSWSAAADGYVDEVAASLDRANQHLGNAKNLLRAAESQVSSSD